MDFKKIIVLFIACMCLGRIEANNFYVFGEFLYCNARIDDLEYALHVNTTIDGLSLTGTGKERNLDFGWDPGVRVGIGSEFCTNWSIDLIGTYLYSRAKGSDSASLDASTEFLHTLWFQSFTGFRAASAAADWSLNFGTLDLIGTYTYDYVHCFNIAPYFGLRAAWIKQHYEIDYTDTLFSMMVGAPLSFPGAHIDMTSRHNAIGFTTGSDFAVPLGCNFAFNAAIGGSLVYGESKVMERVIGAFPIISDDDPVLVATDLSLPSREFRVSANLETEAGFSYRRCWQGHPIEIFLGYFFSVWFDQNDFYNLVFTVTNIVNTDLQDNLTTIANKHSNLELQGLILGASLSF